MWPMTNLMNRLHRDHGVKQPEAVRPIFRAEITWDIHGLSIETEQSFLCEIVHRGGAVEQHVSAH